MKKATQKYILEEIAKIESGEAEATPYQLGRLSALKKIAALEDID